MRTNLSLTYSRLARPYVVHELLFDADPIEDGPLHASELPGQSIRQIGKIWKDILEEDGMKVTATEILHTGTSPVSPPPSLSHLIP